jgi:hypothetical protein
MFSWSITVPKTEYYPMSRMMSSKMTLKLMITQQDDSWKGLTTSASPLYNPLCDRLVS